MINKSNDEKGRNGGKMPLQGTPPSSPWSRRCPGNVYPGSRKIAGPDKPMRPVGGTPAGNPSRTPRP